MISVHDVYVVLSAVVPLYVAMLLAYGSVRWWGILSPDQCSGINRFVAIFAVPLLSFHFISGNDPYHMNSKYIVADVLQKVVVLLALGTWACCTRSGSLDWLITIFKLATLPNTLVMGIPLLQAMYGGHAGALMIQFVVMQSIVWYTLLLFLYEYRAAKRLVMARFPDDAAKIVSFRVDSDVHSIDDGQGIDTTTQPTDDGGIVVNVRRSSSKASDAYSLHSSIAPTPRPSNFNDDAYYNPADFPHSPRFPFKPQLSRKAPPQLEPRLESRLEDDGKELHVFRWTEEVEAKESAPDFTFGSRAEMWVEVQGMEEGGERSKAGAASIVAATTKILEKQDVEMPAPRVMGNLILTMAYKKLIRNPNTYASLAGLVWSLLAFKFHFGLPAIVANSITILSDAGLGMAMFSLGLFMALQKRVIACGPQLAAFSMVVRFLTGPAVMAAASIAVGLRGKELHIAIVQAALPQGLVPFVFAKEYDLHPDILSTAVIFGMLVALPITLLYYVLMEL